MTADDFAETAVDLFEDAPCGYVSTMPDGTILSVNRTFEALTGLERDALVGRRRFQDLLPVAGQLYHETHYRPLLHVSGETREIALEIVCSDGSRLPVLVNSVLARDATGRPRAVRTVVFPAPDRRRYEEELLLAQRRDHEVALRLQRNLLTGTLPQAPGLELAVGYSPGGSGLLAGGDWYDAFWVDPGNMVALVVGDVVGHGLEAAAAMGQLRSATRALASVRLPPSRLLEALGGYADTHMGESMTTLVYAELDLRSHSLVYACAGHPPPLVVPPAGDPFYAMCARSVPIGAWEREERSQATLELEAGTTVLLYTDGLIEHPSRSFDVGLDLLSDVVRAHREAQPESLAAAILEKLYTPDYVDDVCLLAARLSRFLQS